MGLGPISCLFARNELDLCFRSIFVRIVGKKEPEGALLSFREAIGGPLKALLLVKMLVFLLPTGHIKQDNNPIRPKEHGKMRPCWAFRAQKGSCYLQDREKECDLCFLLMIAQLGPLFPVSS